MEVVHANVNFYDMFFPFHKIKILMNAHWLNTLATKMLYVWIQSEATAVLVIRGIQGTAIHVQVVHIVIIILRHLPNRQLYVLGTYDFQEFFFQT